MSNLFQYIPGAPGVYQAVISEIKNDQNSFWRAWCDASIARVLVRV